MARPDQLRGEVGGVAVCYAIGPIILSRHLADVPALGVVAVSLIVAALVYLPFAAFRRPASMPSAHVLESVLGLAVAFEMSVTALALSECTTKSGFPET